MLHSRESSWTFSQETEKYVTKYLIPVCLDFSIPIESAIGHENIATIVSDILGFEVPCNRVSVELSKKDEGVSLLVAQYSGPRLEEGATELPENATIKWWFCHNQAHRE